MYSVKRVKIWDISNLHKIVKILYKCGKDMANEKDLHHWDNSMIKTWAIVFLCALKNCVYLVLFDKIPVATFQTRRLGNALLFQKLATLPSFSGRGIGAFCLNEIEQLAKDLHCDEVVCEVYDKSEHAITFYENRGYVVYGETSTIKYKELKLRKSFKETE